MSYGITTYYRFEGYCHFCIKNIRRVIVNGLFQQFKNGLYDTHTKKRKNTRRDVGLVSYIILQTFRENRIRHDSLILSYFHVKLPIFHDIKWQWPLPSVLQEKYFPDSITKTLWFF